MKEVEWDHDRATEVMRYGTTWREPVQGLADIPGDAEVGESFFDLMDERETLIWLCVGKGEVMQFQASIGPPTCPHCGK